MNWVGRGIFQSRHNSNIGAAEHSIKESKQSRMSADSDSQLTGADLTPAKLHSGKRNLQFL